MFERVLGGLMHEICVREGTAVRAAVREQDPGHPPQRGASRRDTDGHDLVAGEQHVPVAIAEPAHDGRQERGGLELVRE